MDTSRMITAIKGDRAGRPWIEFGGDKLYGIQVSECVFAFPLWDMSDINHVHYFDLRWKFLLSPRVRLARFILVFTLRSLLHVFGVQFAGLLENPAFPIGVIHRFLEGAMNLT